MAEPELHVTPLVRKLAAGYGVDLTTVHGSGVGGRIRKDDVMAAAARLGRERMVAMSVADATGAEYEREFAHLFSDYRPPEQGSDEFDHLFPQRQGD